MTLVHEDKTGDSKTSSLALTAPPQHSTAPALSSWSGPRSGRAPRVGAHCALPHLTDHSCKSNTHMELLHTLNKAVHIQLTLSWIIFCSI